MMIASTGLMRKSENMKRPWVAVAVTVIVLCTLKVVSDSASKEIKSDDKEGTVSTSKEVIKEEERDVIEKEGAEPQSVVGKNGELASDSNNVNTKREQPQEETSSQDKTSSQEATQSSQTTTQDVTAESALVKRLADCKINYDKPDPYGTGTGSSEKPVIHERGYYQEVPEGYRFYFDEVLAQALTCLFEGDWLLELGAGYGHYAKYFTESGRLKGVRAYDGIEDAAERSNNYVQEADLTKKREFGGPFDWVMAIEVAEHIRPEYEDVFIDNIHRHAKKGVIISWAPPGKDALGHVNLRTPEYVQKLFEDMGYVQYKNVGAELSQVARLKWLKNLMVFVLRSHDCTNC